MVVVEEAVALEAVVVVAAVDLEVSDSVTSDLN